MKENEGVVNKFKDKVIEYVKWRRDKNRSDIEYVGNEREERYKRYLRLKGEDIWIEINGGYISIKSSKEKCGKIGMLMKVLRMCEGDCEVLKIGCIRVGEKWVEIGFGSECICIDGGDDELVIDINEVWWMWKKDNKWEMVRLEDLR